MIRSTLLAALLAAPMLATPVAAQETRASAAAKFHAEFRQSDTNKDGSLSRTEVQARIGRMHAGSRPLPPAQKKRLADLWFNRADADKNGRVSEPEAQALLARTFQLYDANHDGRIGGDERAAARGGVTNPR